MNPRGLPRRLISAFADPLIRVHTAVFRLSGGRLGTRVGRIPVLLLETVGRRSGKKRHTPLLYIEDGDDLVVVASKGGSPGHPSWWLNLREMKEATARVGRERRRVIPKEASRRERERLWPRLTTLWPDYDAYQRRTEREIPVVLLMPAEGDGLLEAARRRIPFVGGHSD